MVKRSQLREHQRQSKFFKALHGRIAGVKRFLVVESGVEDDAGRGDGVFAGLFQVDERDFGLLFRERNECLRE